MRERSREPLRIGVLTPHLAVGAEEELPAMAPGCLVTRVVRVVDSDPPATARELRASTAPAAVDEAAKRLSNDPPDAVAYASTTSAYASASDRAGDIRTRTSTAYGFSWIQRLA